MNGIDWTALIIVFFFFFLGSTRWQKYRYQRVIFLIILFLTLYLFPWISALVQSTALIATKSPKKIWIMPFRDYSLYTSPAPESYYHAQPVMVNKQGNEYPIDFRVWQPWIPRYFNIRLRKTLDADRITQQKVGKVLLDKAKSALETYHARDKIKTPSAWLLGNLHYPSHQTPSQYWEAGTNLPTADEIVMIKVYRVSWVATNRQMNPMNYQKEVAYEFRK